jgi:hypothetical protein
MISPEVIQTIVSDVESNGLLEQGLSGLRTRYPGVHFTYCMDDDVGPIEPHLKAQGFNVYLVDGNDHCLKFTRQLEHATGVVLAEVIDDDD